MTLSAFVGREKEIGKLEHALQQGSKKQGSIVFIEGEAGSGKSFLLQGLQEKLNTQPKSGNIQFVYGICYEDSGSQNAYQPFVEILGALLEAKGDREGLTKLFLSIVKEAGSDWLGMIPGIGPAITASVKTATIIAGHWLPGNESKPGGHGENLSSQYIQTISRIADKYAPLVLLIEDAHWIDDASSRLLQRIAQVIRELPLVIIVTCRPSHLTENHPLLSAKNEIRSKSQAEVMPLEGLNESQIYEYIVLRFRNPLDPILSKWLAYLCKGNPLFLTQYLSLLEQTHIINPLDGEYILDGELKYIAGQWELSGGLADFHVPDNVEAVLEQRINRLMEEDREMLQVGAVQGEFFMSSILADVLEKKESDILKRLRKVIERHRLISLYVDSDLDKTRTEIYIFEHALLQKALYNKLGPRERLLYHQNIAEQLGKIIKEEKSPSRKLLLDAAHHFDLGRSPQPAAEYYYLAAETLVADGATIEAAEISKRGLQSIYQVPDAHALKAKIIVQLLSASEKRVHGLSEEQQDRGYAVLIEDAKTAASQTGDSGLMAQVKFVEAVYQLNFGSLTRANVAFREAIEFIKQTNDHIGNYVILSMAGHNLCGEDLRAGLALQYDAQSIFKDKIIKSYEKIPDSLKQKYYMTQRFIGVNEFDLGNYGKSELLLRECVDELKKTLFLDELVGAQNFLGQLLIAIGAFEDAELVIKDALEVGEASSELSNDYYYNLTLLGKLYLEWSRIHDAHEPMQKGFDGSNLRQVKWELPLARNYYVELLMHPEFEGDLDEACRQLDLNIEETQNSGFHRSLVAALSLRSLVALAQNQPDKAEKFSTRAIAHLQKMGTLPALRTEEILFNHYMVLCANDKREDANIYLRQAHKVLMQKADSITKPEHLKSFLERVKVSRAIIDAVNSAGIN